MIRKPIRLLFSVVFMDMVGFAFILPLLPFYAKDFGATPTLAGLLFSAYALGQLIGAPTVGRLSDRFGRKPLLLFSIAGTFASLIMLGFAKSLLVLFISRFLDGITGGNITVAQAYIADSTDEANRAKSLGLIGAAFGLGFIFGPIIGGALSTWGYAVPAFAAAGVAALNLLLLSTLLPESLTKSRRTELALREKTAFSLTMLFRALRRPAIGPMLIILVVYGLASSAFQSIYSLFVQYRLDYTARATGFTLAYVGVLAATVQGAAIGAMTKRFSERRLVIVASLTLAVGLLAWAFTANTVMLLVVLIPTAFGIGVNNTILRSLLTKAVPREEIGGTLGLASSMDSLTRIVAPALGGFLLERVGLWSPGIMGGVLMLWVVVYGAAKLPAAKAPAGAAAPPA